MCSAVKYFKSTFINEIEKFFIKEILEALEDKKPKYETILIIYAFLAEIAGNGRHILELYANLDCRTNRENVVERLMY
jgi:Sec7-like guanine-nucleotide exchange factor